MGAVMQYSQVNPMGHTAPTPLPRLPAWPLPVAAFALKQTPPKQNPLNHSKSLNGSRLSLFIWWPLIKASASMGSVTHQTLVDYSLLDEAGRVRETNRVPISLLPKAHPCTVLVHPFNISLCPFNPPKLSAHKLQQSAGLLTEHMMLTPLEDNWVQLLKPEQSKTNLVAEQQTACIISKVVINNIFQSCEQLQLPLESINSELLFPALSCPLVWEANGLLYCKTEYNPAWCAPIANTDLCVNLLKQAGKAYSALQTEPNQVFVHTSSSSKTQEAVHQLIAAAWSDCWPDAQLTSPPDLNAQLLQQWQKCSAIPDSALQGNIKPNRLFSTSEMPLHQKIHSSASWWQKPSAAIVVFLVSALVALNWRAWQIENRQEHLQTQIRQLFETAMPDTPMNADPELLLQRQIQILADKDSGLQFNAHPISNALQMLGGQMPHFDSGSIESIQYDKQVGHGVFNIVMNGQMRLSDLQKLISENTHQEGESLKKSIQLQMDQKTQTGSYVLSFKVPNHE